eukprot:TRINITY_DN36048_c0_g1_i1.p1 TRINITY_DN36048_c0_g1~~TRINITY_DN36048_c0_g1_i1.p1  ORF type:complete len:437 (+),score=165.78 TRINITY_DN36048_c0_g1_i1:137-1447(+)
MPDAGGVAPPPAAGAHAAAPATADAANNAGALFDDVYRTLDVVGKGSYAVVHRVVHRRTGAVFAAKIIPRRSEGYNPLEGPLLRVARHPHVVDLHDVFTGQHVEILVTELLVGGELLHTLRSAPQFDERAAAAVMGQLLAALVLLHDGMGAVHRDVKLENILLAQPHRASVLPQIKLIDFGFTCALPAAAAGGGAAAATAAAATGRAVQSLHPPAPDDVVLNACCGSPNYLAPEQLKAARAARLRRDGRKARGYGKEVDVWAAGVVLYVLLCKRYPFWHERRAQWFRQIWKGEYQPVDAAVSAEARELVAAMLQVDPSQRLTAAEALAHPWIRRGAAEGRQPDGGSGRQSRASGQSLPDDDRSTPTSGRTPRSRRHSGDEDRKDRKGTPPVVGAAAASAAAADFDTHAAPAPPASSAAAVAGVRFTKPKPPSQQLP